MAEKFSLKDFLFNEIKITAMAQRIYAVYPQFDTTSFLRDVMFKLPQLELKARIAWLAVGFRMIGFQREVGRCIRHKPC